MTGETEGRLQEAVITIGVFDGVHLGHQALIRKVVERAAQRGMVSGCVTFSPHPEDVLRPRSDIAHLAAVEDRLATIKDLGISQVVVVEFTAALSQMLPEDFIGMLEEQFRLRELWVGADFALGRGRSGTPERLAAIGRERGFEVWTLPPVEIGGQVVSSSRIRRLLADGDVEAASLLLGRLYRLRGMVGSGDARGRTLGFATANLVPAERMCVPANGVYAVWARVDHEEPRMAVANIGVRPTFDGQLRQIEVHLLDYAGDLYSRGLAIDFVARLRDELRFESANSLVEQIGRDVARTRQLLAEGPRP